MTTIDDVARIPLPWEQQPNETTRAYHAFQVYRDTPMRERTVLEAWHRVNQGNPEAQARAPHGNFRGWATKHRWLDRAQAWDQESDRRRTEAQQAEIIRMAELHARVAQTQVNALSRPAVELLRRLNENPELLRGVETERLVDMLVRASRAIPQMANMERVSRADPEAKTIPTFSADRLVEPRSLVDDVEDAAAAWRALQEAGVVPEDAAE